MKAVLATLALVAGSHALVARDSGCCAGITVYSGSSGPSGPLGQLSDGQNRAGDSSLPAGKYCLGADGGFLDGQGRGCILTPPTTQWQCDVGATPTTGFAIGCNGTISHDGDDTFYACDTGDNGGWNIYSEPIENEPTCVEIWMLADSCHSGCPSSLPHSSTKPPPPPPAPKAPAACPADLTGDWQFPHLIIPVDSAKPDKAYGTQFNGTASGTMSSIFNFDIPASYAGKQCSLQFLFPTRDQLETSAFEYTAGKFNFAFLGSAADDDTCYANQPKVYYDFGDFQLTPGTATQIGQCPDGCASGQTIAFSMSPVGSASLNYFQDSNPCPIGMYITAH